MGIIIKSDLIILSGGVLHSWFADIGSDVVYQSIQMSWPNLFDKGNESSALHFIRDVCDESMDFAWVLGLPLLFQLMNELSCSCNDADFSAEVKKSWGSEG